MGLFKLIQKERAIRDQTRAEQSRRRTTRFKKRANRTNTRQDVSRSVRQQYKHRKKYGGY